MGVYAAVDLGASSGRVMAGVVTDDSIELVEVHRFGNEPVRRDDHLYWDLERLLDEVVTGLVALQNRYDDVISVGIDTWAVDYGLLDADGAVIGDPFAYRDDRTSAPVIAAVHAAIDPQRLYEITGLQHLPFNTVYQLAAERDGDRRERARTLLMIPDLLAYRLTGQRVAEITNASTTGLLDATTRTWSTEICDRVGIDASWLPRLVEPGTTIGTLDHDRLRPVPVVAVGSHDTASAVVAVPAAGDDFGYVSSGTWSLVGTELATPVLSEASRDANFTNEGGVDATVRYLRNVGGLWLLEQCREQWGDRAPGLAELITEADRVGDAGSRVDVDAEEFIAPGDMVARIQQACEQRGLAVPTTPAEITRCILDSLADAYARTIARARELSGHAIETVHIVGGGAQNELLCRLTAAATGTEVLAGPVEATALGNIAVQARAAGEAPADLAGIRALIARTAEPRRYHP